MSESKIVVTANNPYNNNYDYTFLTPYFTKGSIKIQGNPALIQFKPTPQPNNPDGSEGGKYLSSLTTKADGGKTIFHALHADGDSNLYYQRYDSGQWTYQVLRPSGVLSIHGSKMIEKEGLLFIVAATDKGLYQAISDLSETRISFAEKFIASGDIQGIDSIVSNSGINYLYINESNSSQLMLTNVSGSGAITTKIVSTKPVKHFSMTNNLAGDLRMVLDDGQKLIYVTHQNGKFYQEQYKSGNRGTRY